MRQQLRSPGAFAMRANDRRFWEALRRPSGVGRQSSINDRYGAQFATIAVGRLQPYRAGNRIGLRHGVSPNRIQIGYPRNVASNRAATLICAYRPRLALYVTYRRRKAPTRNDFSRSIAAGVASWGGISGDGSFDEDFGVAHRLGGKVSVPSKPAELTYIQIR